LAQRARVQLTSTNVTRLTLKKKIQTTEKQHQ
jgi:hypothetical protein